MIKNLGPPKANLNPMLKSHSNAESPSAERSSPLHSHPLPSATPPLEPTPALAQTSAQAVDYDAIKASILAALQPQLSDFRTTILSEAPSNLTNTSSAVQSGSSSFDQRFKSRVSAIFAHLPEHAPSDSSQPDMPPTDPLPDSEPQSP